MHPAREGRRQPCRGRGATNGQAPHERREGSKGPGDVRGLEGTGLHMPCGCPPVHAHAFRMPCTCSCTNAAQYAQEYAEMSELRRAVDATRKRIEDLFVVHCPRCNAGLHEFDGCVAITCSHWRNGREYGEVARKLCGSLPRVTSLRAHLLTHVWHGAPLLRCGAGFCALCLEDCGVDAHAHVASTWREGL